MGLGGVAIAVSPYVIHPKTAVLGRAGGGEQEKKYVELVYHTTTSYNFLSPITTSCKPGCLFLLKQKLSI